MSNDYLIKNDLGKSDYFTLHKLTYVKEDDRYFKLFLRRLLIAYINTTVSTLSHVLVIF